MAANNDPRLPQVQFYPDASRYDRDLNSALLQELRDVKRDADMLRKKVDQLVGKINELRAIESLTPPVTLS